MSLQTRALVVSLIFILFGCCGCNRPASPPPHYTLTDLGTLGSYTSSRARGINNSGKIVGEVSSPGGATHAFIYDIAARTLQDLGVNFGGRDSAAYAVNDRGQVVGYAQNADGDDHAFRWQSGAPAEDITPLNPDDPPRMPARALGISSEGPAAGYFMLLPDPTEFAFYGGGAHWHPDPYFQRGRANAVANRGPDEFVYVGRNWVWGPFFHAFKDHGTSLVDLGTLPGTDRNNCSSEAYGVNVHGHVVGYSDVGNPITGGHAFLYFAANPGMIDLGTLEGDNHSEARALTDTRVPTDLKIVGFSRADGRVSRAVLWWHWTPRDLNGLIDDHSWQLIEASDINERGQIVGWGRHNNQERAFLLTPQAPSIDTSGVITPPGRSP